MPDQGLQKAWNEFKRTGRKPGDTHGGKKRDKAKAKAAKAARKKCKR